MFTRRSRQPRLPKPAAAGFLGVLTYIAASSAPPLEPPVQAAVPPVAGDRDAAPRPAPSPTGATKPTDTRRP